MSMSKGTYKKATIHSATNTLERFFSKYPNADSITVEEALIGAGRDAEEYQSKNEGWLSNKLTGLYYHGFVNPVYSHRPYRKLEKLELTSKGKKALNRLEELSSPHNEESTADQISYFTLVKAVAAFKKDNPEYEVRFEVKLKERLETPMSQ